MSYVYIFAGIMLAIAGGAAVDGSTTVLANLVGFGTSLLGVCLLAVGAVYAAVDWRA